MFKSNHFYGHVRVLRAYCGGLTPPFVPGILQHGWTVGDGVGAQHHGGRWPKYVWGARNLAHARSVGLEHVRPIGAEFLYLPTPETTPSSKSLVVFPFHGWQQQKVLGDMEAYARRLEELRAEGFEQITVCLYYLDHDDPEIRRLFESRGFPTVTAGPRLANPRFLEKIQRLLLNHAYASSNRVCTASFYALYLKRKFFLYGPPMGLSRTDDPTGERFDAWQRAEFPQLTWGAFRDESEAALGERELGAEYKLTPHALQETLLWSPAQLRPLSRAMLSRARDLGGKAARKARIRRG